MKRTHKNLISAPHLNALTKIHHHNRIGEMVHDAEIVGDKNISQPHFFLKVQQKIQNLSLNRNIQGGNRFVANNKLGIYRYCSGNSNPLQSSGVKLKWITVEILQRKPYQFHQLQHTLAALLLTFYIPIQKNRLLNALSDCMMRIQT